ncbi:hypothetical protein [Nocardia transvalensis]|uniref:hypothetical protein n=1 Tax=Nocardia transvalensis TaxID=37333 RepID=UPI00189358CB|nr:hypothetical protein [Nocardia transvalensis]MBF6330895.1 hypothetical protein [Nocardia transvalensis]
MTTLGSPAGGTTVADPRAGLLDLRSAPITYGYYAENATGAETIEQCHRGPRRGPIGWWNRHPHLRLGVGAAMAVNLGFLPAVQDALLSALQHMA